MNLLLKPFLHKIMGRRYQPHHTLEDYVTELISENTNTIVNKHLAITMECLIKALSQRSEGYDLTKTENGLRYARK